jgi:hypothetical protein
MTYLKVNTCETVNFDKKQRKTLIFDCCECERAIEVILNNIFCCPKHSLFPYTLKFSTSKFVEISNVGSKKF